MHPAVWLESAFGSEARIRILRLLVTELGRARSEREIAGAIGMSANAVNKAVRSLVEAGLVEIERIGRTHAVRLADEPALVDGLRAIFGIENATWRRTVEAIRSAVPADSVCYLFGSSTRGTARAESDLDLLVIAKDRATGTDAAYAIETRVGTEMPARLNVLTLTTAEAKKRFRRPGVIRDAILHGERLSKESLDDLVAA